LPTTLMQPKSLLPDFQPLSSKNILNIKEMFHVKHLAGFPSFSLVFHVKHLAAR
jgi:hypothetical protein